MSGHHREAIPAVAESDKRARAVWTYGRDGRGGFVPYRVKEMFYSLQGEGANAGRPAVFVRFAGCNLWSGREEDRGNGPGACSAWCDTDFRGGTVYENAGELAADVFSLWPKSERPFVVLTGGEPLLQADAE